MRKWFDTLRTPQAKQRGRSPALITSACVALTVTSSTGTGLSVRCWVAVALVAILAFGQANAPCRHCESPARTECHHCDDAARHDSRGADEESSSRSGGCQCPAHHLSCANSGGSVVELAGVSYSHAPGLPTVDSCGAFAGLEHAARRTWRVGISPPRSHPPLYLTLRVLLI